MSWIPIRELQNLPLLYSGLRKLQCARSSYLRRAMEYRHKLDYRASNRTISDSQGHRRVVCSPGVRRSPLQSLSVTGREGWPGIS